MNDMLKLISGGENEGLEFKESLRLKEEIGKAVSAFSNASGGLILVGVSNDGKVIGVDIGRNTLEELANYIKRNTDPAIFPSMKVLDAGGKKIIVIEVKESAEKPVFFKNHAYKRVKNNKLTNAAILLFGKEPQKFFLQTKLRCAKSTAYRASESPHESKKKLTKNSWWAKKVVIRSDKI